MEKKPGYDGKIKNTGPQIVSAVHKQPAGASCKVQRGTDLRTGKKK